MNYKDFNLGDWIGHISGVIEDETTLDGNEMRDLVEFLSMLEQEPTTKNDLEVDGCIHKCIDKLTEDCISRADAIKGLGEQPYVWTDSDFEIQQLADWKTHKEMLENLPSVTPQEPRWIPVKEMLPKAGEYVGDVAKYYLVQDEYGDMLVARYTHSGYWEQIYQLKPYADEIVAWMPLPKSYEPQESEG